MTERGKYVELDGRPAVRFIRVYAHSIDRVWAAVSDPSELAAWFPSKVEIDPEPGGTISFSGDPRLEGTQGTVLAIDPPRHLSFTWGPDELRFDLDPIDEHSCRFTLTNVLAERDTAARNGAGWEVCLAELDKHFRGVASEGPHSDDALEWKPIYAEYVAAGVPSGASIPDAKG
jgi:uncharacterized protein YndB with AHSA1/START domain